ncbi:AP2/ERF and B3 domain-containing transcription factor At1g50680-like [Andrographis paniculata]|uniref:AP2/ERF and B3 domain-containing transcription factor At1g50680-like n=1 Tax=Andrographis paniculata TaxID=175694 RepID=UPI0021E71CB2|nr:AP2/ERF and B3 domain-containing transcription factor At1g50680-like [Andrographis paniculata]XP_051148703.1 AP2/ERF and B3 domain-containing transcription factor At1g50680-like [Andrographis paniculata]
MDFRSLFYNATAKNSTSDSGSSSNPTAVSASKLKGVVSQINGHWGAQIYADHQRIWLGTFKSEAEAAMAYDSAAIRLRSGQNHRNFPWTATTLKEPSFQSHFSTQALLGMIRDGSYPAMFVDFLQAQDGIQHPTRPSSPLLSWVPIKQLFQKELTPSDVGKLNRLVIPKRYAEKYFPVVSSASRKSRRGSDDLELVFVDRFMRSWKFRYCYWKSSQSFVFTRGWNGFAKEKGLKARDYVIFSSYRCGDKNVCMIDVAYKNGSCAAIGASSDGNCNDQRMDNGSVGMKAPDFKLFGNYPLAGVGAASESVSSIKLFGVTASTTVSGNNGLEIPLENRPSFKLFGTDLTTDAYGGAMKVPAENGPGFRLFGVTAPPIVADMNVPVENGSGFKLFGVEACIGSVNGCGGVMENGSGFKLFGANVAAENGAGFGLFGNAVVKMPVVENGAGFKLFGVEI